MAPVQKLNDFKLMLFVLSFTLTIIYTCMHFSNGIGIRQIRNASLRSKVE